MFELCAQNFYRPNPTIPSTTITSPTSSSPQKLLNKVSVGRAARCMSFSGDGEMLAVGLKNGEFLVLLTNSLKVWTKRRDRSTAIQDLR